MIKTFSFFESSSFTFICHSSGSALEEILVQVDLVWDTSRFAFAVSFSSSRSHHGALWFFITSWLFVGLVSGYFIGFFRPLVGGFFSKILLAIKWWALKRRIFFSGFVKFLKYFWRSLLRASYSVGVCLPLKFFVDFLRSPTPCVRMWWNAMYPLLLLSPSVNNVEFRREQQRYSSCACVGGRVFNFVASFLHLVANTNCGCCRS